MGIDLPALWGLIILFATMMYVVMDGFDLGIGLLFPFFAERHERDRMMNTVAPIWDGNETWLVLGGAGSFAAFPTAYAIVLSAFYLPLVLMLVGLVFRGVAFEFRFKSTQSHRRWWDAAFAGGSLTAAFFQGVTLGGYLDGIAVRDGRYAGGPWDWLSPFSLFTGAGLVVAYALLGATWLVLKTEEDLQARMRHAARRLALALFGVIAVVSAYTPLAHAFIARRWFTLPDLLWFSPVPILVVVLTARLLHVLRGQSHAEPFLLTLGLVFLGYTGLAISLWPLAVPPSLTFRDVAGPPQSLGFSLVGALFVIPFILMYTAFSYWVFRGKVRPEHLYH